MATSGRIAKIAVEFIQNGVQFSRTSEIFGNQCNMRFTDGTTLHHCAICYLNPPLNSISGMIILQSYQTVELGAHAHLKAIQEMISESGTVKVGKETKKASDLYG